MNKLKENRISSFIAVLFVYVIATIAGILTYEALPFEFYISLFIADTIATVVTFVFSLIFKNSSVYDPYWSVAPIVILVYAGIKNGVTLYGVLLLFVVLLWGLRLTANWAYTFKNLFNQDWRYTMLKEQTGKFYPIINFVGIHYVPTIVVYFCILPAVHMIEKGEKGNALSIIALLICVFAILLQGVSDFQMHRYRKHRKTPFIREGLWKYSRHPNYLGEILMWWGVGISCILAEPDGWYLISGAVINTMLFLFVSIPMADKRQSKKEGFEEYKNQTHMLLPILKKH